MHTNNTDAKKQIKLIKIFIATPSDLENEREIFREVIDELNNDSKFSNKYYFKAVGWENTLIGKGRPQGLINEDLKKSDLVVCILWKRWGSPSGKYSSGFEEEFIIANELNKDIWLYFKNVPSYMLEDPGPQLKKVLDFRKQIEKEKTFLYRSYETENDWKINFKNDLLKYINKQVTLAFCNLSENININRNIITYFLDKKITNPSENHIFNPFLGSTQVVLDAVDKFYKLGHYLEAEEIYINALKYSTPNNPLLLLNYAGFLVKIGSYNKAILRINELLDCIEKIDKKKSLNVLKAQLYWTLASIYYEYSKEYDLSATYYEKAIGAYELEKDYEHIMYCCKLMLRPLGEDSIDDNGDKRDFILNKALIASKKNDSHIDSVRILNALSLLYKELKNDRENCKNCLLEANQILKKYNINDETVVKNLKEHMQLSNMNLEI